jgi:hypothetical protein
MPATTHVLAVYASRENVTIFPARLASGSVCDHLIQAELLFFYFHRLGSISQFQMEIPLRLPSAPDFLKKTQINALY